MHITAFRREKEISQARNSNLVHFVAEEFLIVTCPTENIEKADTVANESEVWTNAKTSVELNVEFHSLVTDFTLHHASLYEKRTMQIQRWRKIIIPWLILAKPTEV